MGVWRGSNYGLHRYADDAPTRGKRPASPAQDLGRWLSRARCSVYSAAIDHAISHVQEAAGHPRIPSAAGVAGHEAEFAPGTGTDLTPRPISLRTLETAS